jgi:hypothetical protein
MDSIRQALYGKWRDIVNSNYALRFPFIRGIDLLHVISESGFLFLGYKVSEI